MKLALYGGKPIRTKPLAQPNVGGEAELRAVRKVLKSGRLYYGLGVDADRPGRYAFGREFEGQFAAYHGAKYGILVSNGSIAIAMALRAAGVKPGDEVIFQPYTCYANVDPVLQVGGVPVFVDIEPETYCIDVGRIEEKVTSRTRAIIAIHWGGRPADLDALRRIATKHELILIEDAAVAQGAEWKGKKVGNMGLLSTFSFGCGKQMSCGEAGMVLTSNKRLANKCYALRDRGRNSKGEVCEIGWNCRVSEILAGFLLERLKKYPSQLRHVTRNAQYLYRGLEGIPGIKLLREDERITQHGFSLIIFRFDEDEFGISREQFITAMSAEGIHLGGAEYPVPLYRSALFRKGLLDEYLGSFRGYRARDDYRPADYPESERAYRKEAIRLHYDSFLGPRSDMDDILAAIHKVREHLDEVNRTDKQGRLSPRRRRQPRENHR